MTRSLTLLAALLLSGTTLWTRADATRQAPPPSDDARLTAPPGFEVQEVYAPDVSGSIVMITFDSDGALVVARERGPVVRLRDTNGDGRLDAEQVVTDQVTNCHGLLFDGPDLLAVGTGPEGTGLYRVADTNGDGAGDSVTLITASTGPIAEHGPHTIVFGPEGHLYWILGNHTGLVPTPAPLSPYRDWHEDQVIPAYTDARGHAANIRAPGGTVVRRDLAGGANDWEYVAGGFRNAYDAGFNLAGELFTFDSDMEWDINMPWYRPVRTVHIVPGGEYGWRTGSGKWPAYYPDSLPPLSDVGRGSPVGITFYQGHVYPAKYRDALLLGDWSRGRILVGFHTPDGATYTETLEDFVLGTPLNVTAVAVGPDGLAYFSKGGRNTEGGLYRVAYRGPDAGATTASPGSPGVERALAQPQPRSAWGRAAIRAARADAGDAWTASLTAIARGAAESPDRRVRALELLQVYGSAPDVAMLSALGADPAHEVRAAALLYLGLHQTDDARRAALARLTDAHPVVQRRAAEALVRSGIHPAMTPPVDPVTDVLPLLGHDDRFVRYAAREVLRRVNRNRWSEAAFAVDTFPGATEALLALTQTTVAATDIRPILARELELLKSGVPDAHLRTFLRVLHLTMIRDAGVNHTNVYNEIATLLLPRFPAGDPGTNRELALTFARLGTADAIPKIVTLLQAPGTHREDQIFLMYALRAMPAGWEEAERRSVVQWFVKTQDERWRGGASFTGFLEKMWTDFLDVLPAEEREAAEDAIPSFRPPPVLTTGAPAGPSRPDTAALSNEELAEFMTLDPMAYTGDAAKGADAFDKALCSACHRFGDLGESAGPDLTDVGRRFKRADLLEAIIYPSKTISDQWASVEILTRDRRSLVGTVTSETADAITLQPVGADVVTIPISQIASRTTSTVSAMPEGLLNMLSIREIANLLAFLEKGPGE
jgi:putative heme-binding domain-containing protein